jgi:hypothetical protein
MEKENKIFPLIKLQREREREKRDQVVEPKKTRERSI